MVYALNLVFLCYLRHIRTIQLHSSRTSQFTIDGYDVWLQHLENSTIFGLGKSKSGLFTSLFSFSFTTVGHVYLHEKSASQHGEDLRVFCARAEQTELCEDRGVDVVLVQSQLGGEFTTSTLRSPGTVVVFVFFVFCLSFFVGLFVCFLCLFVCLFVCFWSFFDLFLLSFHFIGPHTIPIKGFLWE